MAVACESWLALLESNRLFSRAFIIPACVRAPPPFIQFLRTAITLSSCQPLYYYHLYIILILVVLCFPHWKSSYCVAPFWKALVGAECKIPRNAGQLFFLGHTAIRDIASQAFLCSCIEPQNVSTQILLTQKLGISNCSRAV